MKRPLSQTLNRRRLDLGLTYEDVQARLEKLGVDVSNSAVGHWFTGFREPKTLNVLEKLCEALETSLPQLLTEHVEYARDHNEQVLLDQFRLMTREQRAAYVVLGTSMVTTKKEKDQ